MKRKRIGLQLIGAGLICIVLSFCMLWDGQKQEDSIASKVATEDSEEEHSDTEEGGSAGTTIEKQQEALAAMTTAIELEQDKPVYEINADMYEWPYGNSRYSNYKEPDMVVYLAQRKEWFDEMVSDFQYLQGREDVYGLIGWDKEEQMVYYDPLVSKEIVAKYDRYEQFFREGIIDSMDVDGDGFSFEAVQDSHEYLYYYYDETRNEETDEFLADNHIVHVAPHWWWQEPTDPH